MITTIFLKIQKNYSRLCFLLQVRESDESDPFRERTVMLLDDFKISGINGTRILSNISLIEINDLIMRKPLLILCKLQKHRSVLASARSDLCLYCRCLDSRTSRKQRLVSLHIHTFLSSTMLKHLLLRNLLADQSQILCGAALGRGNEILFATCGSHEQDGRHAHIW